MRKASQDISSLNLSRLDLNATVAEEIGLPKLHGDFRPDLKQDIEIYDGVIPAYMKCNN